MAAEMLSRAGVAVSVYEARPSMGRKFLVAGKGGLNLTHSEPYDSFLRRYGDRAAALETFLDTFGPEELRTWAAELGFPTFVGSSGRVFPEGMRAAPLLRAWLARLRLAGVQFHTRHRWSGWNQDGGLRFETPRGEVSVHPDAVLLALGGASWPQLGSDGAWVSILQAAGIAVAPLEPANCGFDVAWTPHFSERWAGQAVKSVRLRCSAPNGEQFDQKGEFVISAYGVEGSLIYAASRPLRQALAADGTAVLHLDLLPDFTHADLETRLSRPRGSKTLSAHMERQAGLRGVKAGLLYEVASKAELAENRLLAARIKDLSVPVIRPRPIAEAISTAGGVSFEALDGRLMLRALPGVFCAGEMLDWEAPTGGYLLTACFATGRAAGLGILSWLAEQG